MQKITLKTMKETERLARQVAHSLKGGDVLALSGPLGAGKTTFTQILAKVLGIKSKVKSPTFTMLQTHALRRVSAVDLDPLTFCHVDAYRIKSIDELAAIGLLDYIGQPNVITVIEWAEKVKKVLPKRTRWFIFSLSKNGRSVTLKH